MAYAQYRVNVPSSRHAQYVSVPVNSASDPSTYLDFLQLSQHAQPHDPHDPHEQQHQQIQPQHHVHQLQTTPTQPQADVYSPQGHPSTPSASPQHGQHPKPPYGAGDSEEGYTLVFVNMATFNAWRLQEEESKCIEFVKGDMHQSKAIPHDSKSTRSWKKYIKKHPERQRKVPSRKIEGEGCPASISFKTYYGTDEVRASYNPNHSHEIGEANIPFTRRGRKAMALAKAESKKRRRTGDSEEANPEGKPSDGEDEPSPSDTMTETNHVTESMGGATVDDSANLSDHTLLPSPMNDSLMTSALGLSGPHGTVLRPYSHIPTSPVRQTHQPQPHTPSHTPVHTSPAAFHHRQPPLSHPPTPRMHSNSIGQPQSQLPTPPSAQSHSALLHSLRHSNIPLQGVSTPASVSPDQARWNRMTVLFESVRNHARTVEFSPASVAALEAVLVRLHLESPPAPPIPAGTAAGGAPILGLHLNLNTLEHQANSL
ncbi:uncharacterized protein EI90DRAFT_3151798 [Cantharellus anzutake]|uniref:uncharacterized protein n=1 Tax=Cantharellus anzutake TaxID=1750568 RepID=UPI00190616E5|nr:uncharacterized protein EI90DRAFT_3151798 [Cantharellus anzutake]KAF8337944.1 hypothetical protein EI90DRAFT_3151798 [Cantharellus anzutake]